MEAKPLWPRISLVHLNIVLYLLITLVVVIFWPQLRWAMDTFPGYFDGNIQSPVERTSYRQAKKIFLTGQNISDAHTLLEQSLLIDPNSEAVFWLGEYFLRTHQDERALEQFRAFIEFDPTVGEAYVKVSFLFQRKQRMKEAYLVLQKGVEYFERGMSAYRPQHDEDVPLKYNQKASRVFSQFQQAAHMLKMEIKRLETSTTQNAGTLESSYSP